MRTKRLSLLAFLGVGSFLFPLAHAFQSVVSRRTSELRATKVTPLPPGLSPFEKAQAKSLDTLGNFRKLASISINKAVADGVRKIEVDFPPFIADNKSQYDDYDNISELDTNRDWCVQLLPLLKLSNPTWLVLPDDKECELASTEWKGKLYRAAKFTSIRGACDAVQAPNTKKAWGTSLAESVNRLQGGDGILADSSKIDSLQADDVDSDRFHLVCQPGNGGPVEDWINVEALHDDSKSITTCVVNGALDKVRDGYYPAIFFPALAKTVPFYKSFESVFFAKPIADKGCAGWLFRCYPEPWQVVLQTPVTGKAGTLTIENSVVLQSATRPSYAQIIKSMVEAAATASK